MSVFSAVAAEVETFKTKLAADAGHLLGEFEALWDKVTGSAAADAADIAKQAETAAGPVVATAEADAAALASEAVAGAEAAAAPPKPTA
jgi:hypothetical protein